VRRVTTAANPKRLESRSALATDLSVQLVGVVLRIERTDDDDANLVRKSTTS